MVNSDHVTGRSELLFKAASVLLLGTIICARVIQSASTSLPYWGNSGSALQVGPQNAQPDSSRKFNLWTTRGPLPTSGFRQETVVDGITVYSDGSRLVWRAEGLNVWVRADQASSALPGGTMLARLVAASRTVSFVPDRS
jgi:hypothetical protein